MNPHTRIVLLRGINVGGRNVLPMADLARHCAACGGEGVRTYIQSGNVVLTLEGAEGEFAAALSDRIEAGNGLRVPVVVLTGAELARALGAAPFPDAAPGTVHYAFLSALPAAAAVAALDPERSPGDRFAVEGRAVFLHMPNGVARTKLTNAWLDRALGVVSTVRNRATIDALWRLAGGVGGR